MNVLLPALVLLVVAPVAAQHEPVPDARYYLICRRDMNFHIFGIKGVYSDFSDLVIDESTGNFIVPNATALETFTDHCKLEPGRGSVIEASKYYGTDFMCDGRSGFSNIPLCVADSCNPVDAKTWLSMALPSKLPSVRNLDACLGCYPDMSNIFESDVYSDFKSSVLIRQIGGNFTVNGDALVTFTERCVSEAGSIKYGYGCDDWFPGLSSDSIPLCVANSCDDKDAEISLISLLPDVLNLDEDNLADEDWWCHDDTGSLGDPPSGGPFCKSTKSPSGAPSSSSGLSSKSTKGWSKASKSSKGNRSKPDCLTDMFHIFRNSNLYSDYKSSLFIRRLNGNLAVNDDALEIFTDCCKSENGSITYAYGCGDWYPGLSSDSIPLCVADSCSDEEAKFILRIFLLPHVLGLDEGSNVDDEDWWCHDDAGSLDGPPPSGAPSSSSGPSSRSTKGSKASKSSKQGKSSKSEDSSWEY